MSNSDGSIGKRGYFFFLLFQCFINGEWYFTMLRAADATHPLSVEVDGTDDRPGMHSNRSIILGQPGPYIPFPSHSFLSYLGPNSYILLLDCRYIFYPSYELLKCWTDPTNDRAERKKDQVCSRFEYEKVFARLDALPSSVQHLIVLVGK